MKIHIVIFAIGLILLTSVASAGTPVMRKTLTDAEWQKAEMNYVLGLQSENDGVRQSAANFIAEYKLKGGCKTLINVLNTDKVENIRIAAALALITLGEKEGREAVEDAALYDGSERVAKFCESLLSASVDKLSYNE